MGKAGLPFWLALFIGNVVSVVLLNWLVPWVSRGFGWWLAPARDAGGRNQPRRRGRWLFCSTPHGSSCSRSSDDGNRARETGRDATAAAQRCVCGRAPWSKLLLSAVLLTVSPPRKRPNPCPMRGRPVRRSREIPVQSIS